MCRGHRNPADEASGRFAGVEIHDLGRVDLGRPVADLGAKGICLAIVSTEALRALADITRDPVPSDGELIPDKRDPMRTEGRLLRRRIARAILSATVGARPDAIHFTSNANGAPEVIVPGCHWHVSFSARGPIGLIGIADQPLGVDLEMPDIGEIPVNVLTIIERNALMALPNEIQYQTFLRLWTLKEAMAKALGKGFSIAPETLCIPDAGSIDGFRLLEGPENRILKDVSVLTRKDFQVLCSRKLGVEERRMRTPTLAAVTLPRDPAAP